VFYDLAASTWGNEEKQALNSVIESGFLTMGKNVKKFELEFSSYMDKKYAVMVNSGSSANLIAVASLFYKKNNPLKRGDEVIVPAISWSTTFHPLYQYGLKLKIIDIELDTLNIDIKQVEKNITENTKAIVGVSILGNPAHLDQLRALADKYNLYFIEDNCESMDAELNGKKTGSFGDISTFSFFFSHHIATIEGGMVLTDNEELFHLCLSLRAHGWTRDLPESTDLIDKKNDDDLFEAYRFILPGYNVRSTELSAVLGIEQLKKLKKMTEQRRKNLKVFQSLFIGDQRFIIQKENGVSSAFSFTIILNPEMNIDRRKVFSSLKDNDIGFRIITGGCILRHEVIKYYDYETPDEIINANIAHDFGFFVGNYPQDLTKQLTKLYEVLDRVA